MRPKSPDLEVKNRIAEAYQLDPQDVILWGITRQDDGSQLVQVHVFGDAYDVLVTDNSVVTVR